MKLEKLNEHSSVLRLTALWGLNETALGGVLHLFRSPFTGLFVGGLAIILISLIAYFSTTPFRSILKALMVVLILKFTLSPHSPITAYVAVSFQALAGGILFSLLPYRIAAIIFAVTAMLESVFQKLLVFTLLFGKPLWESLDIFMEQVVSRLGFAGLEGRGSFILIGAYAALYGIAGLFVGSYVGRLPDKLSRMLPDLRIIEGEFLTYNSTQSRERSFLETSLFRIAFVVLLVTGFIFLFLPGGGESRNGLTIFLRATSVLLLWFVIVSPILRYFLGRFIARQQTTYQSELRSSLELLPVFKNLLARAWSDVSDYSGLKKIDRWVTRALGYCLIYRSDKKDGSSA